MALITPDISDAVLNKNVQQIYPICNAIYRQMTGREDVQAVDTNSFIAMGRSIQESLGTERWLNTLSRRIGLTIDSHRAYRNRYSDLARTQLEWGAIVQKIEAEMPEATMDKTFDVGMMDGQSVDQWIINNPKVHQKFFDKEAPYSFFITMQTKLLKRAFLNESVMASLITQIFGKVQNKIELTNEGLARLALANLVLNLRSRQEFHLVTMYNNAKSASLSTGDAMYDHDFLRFAMATFNQVSRKMESMSVLYNVEGKDRFTPKSEQRFYVLSDFMTLLETIPGYLSFVESEKSKKPDIYVPYWQGSNTDTDLNNWENVASIKGTNARKEEVTVSNLVGIMFDREAVGTFRQEEEVLTTPVNARARYYNTFWHEDEFWFNMTDENVVAFYLD